MNFSLDLTESEKIKLIKVIGDFGGDFINYTKVDEFYVFNFFANQEIRTEISRELAENYPEIFEKLN